ncbi:hypothetical protein M0R45_005798 [Rubus argutus]|uniref:Cyclic nucleotide-binding domain-containing protein n=1 Tax=Rubus argutus TaxID=59490 RepID=A0AAW1YNT6_RUBAR
MANCSRTLERSAGELYGEKLFSWPTWTSFPTLPVATESVKADGDVEALVLMASDILDDEWPQSSLRSYILSQEITCLGDDECELLEIDRVTMLRKVPKLETMDTRVLKAISEKLKSMSCIAYMNIIIEGKPLRKMVFITGGSMFLKKHGYRANEERQFYGEELLDWVLDRSFPVIVPVSTHSVSVHINTNVLVLMVNDLCDVVSNFKSHFSKKSTIPTDDYSLDLCAFVGLTWLKKVPKLEHTDDIMLNKFCNKLIIMRYGDESPYIIEEELDKIFLIVSGLVSITSIKGGQKVYRYSGNYWGDELFEWALHPSRAYNHSLPTSDVCVEAVGDVEVLLLKANDLIRLISESEFLKDTSDNDINSTYMQFITKKKRYVHARIQKKMEKKGREVKWWLTKNGIPLCKQSEIMEKALEKLEENKDVDVEKILPVLPSDLQSYIESCMPLNRLKQVPLPQNMDENVLRAISEYLVPKKYTKNDIIIREKEPLQMMIFIVEGCVIIEKRDFPSTLKRRAGEVYGEKLLSWPAWTSFPTLPIATESVRTDDDVEALVLMVTDMQEIGWKFREYFSSMKITRLTDDEWEVLESSWMTILRKVSLVLS